MLDDRELLTKVQSTLGRSAILSHADEWALLVPLSHVSAGRTADVVIAYSHLALTHHDTLGWSLEINTGQHTAAIVHPIESELHEAEVASWVDDVATGIVEIVDDEVLERSGD